MRLQYDKSIRKRAPIAQTLALLFLTMALLAQTLYAQEARRRRTQKEPPPNAAGLVERAAPGRIVGVVVDATTGETLAGTTVRLGVLGTAANYEGKFEFEALPPGTYALSFDMVSYKPFTLSEVVVKPGKTVEVRAALVEDVKTLETVVVEGEMRKSSDAALVAVQKNAVQISDGYSGDMVLKQTPSFQFNTVLRRMPGVALVEDRYLSIRGLFERYNTFTLNGAPIPINDFERNGFDYSYLPSNLISSLRIVKTASSEIINEFGGGYVRMETADIPAENNLQVFVQGEYHPITTFKPMELRPTNSRPFLFAELRGLPGDFPSPAALGTSPGPSTPENQAAARILADGKLLTSRPTQTTAAPGTNMGVSWQRRFKIADNPAGFTAYVGHFSHNRNTPIVQKLAALEREAGVRPALIDSIGTDYFRRESNLTAMANAGMRLGTKGKLTLKNLLVHHAENAFLPMVGNSGGYSYFYPVNRVRATTLYAGQALWEQTAFSLPAGPAVISINPFYSFMDNREPSMAGYNFALDSLYQNPVFDAYESEYLAVWTARQKHHLGGANFQIEAPVGPKGTKLAVGMMLYHNVHEYRSRFISYSFPADSAGELIYPDEETLRYEPGVDYFSRLIETGELVVYDRTDPVQNYRSHRTLWAPFVQAGYRPIPKLMLNGGIRIETYRQRVVATPLDSASFDLVAGTLTDVLPSFNAAYSLTPKTNLRLAYCQTAIRPRDRELVPFNFLEYASSIKTRGNAELIRTKTHNIDLRYEFYPRKADLVSVTAFYKYFRNTIEQVLNEGYLVGVVDPIVIYEVRNQKAAAIAGLEFEFRQSLEPYVQSPWLKGLGVYGNLSLMASRVNPAGAFDLFGAGRSLQGQANFLFNLGLTYAEEKTGLSAAVFYNRAGRRIAWVGISDDLYPSIVEMPRDVVDLQVSKTFFDKLTVRFAVQDLLGQRFRLIQFYDGRKDFDENRDLVVRNERRAPSLFLTASYRF
mgnify:CR=1 FL=1